MANIKISALPVASTPLSGGEEIPIVQLGNTVKTTANDLSSFLPKVTLQQVLNYNNSLINGINLQGKGAGANQTGINVNAMGEDAAAYNTANNVNAIGKYAAQSNTGVNVNGLGYQSALNNTGAYVNAMGIQSAKGNTANHVNAFGQQAGENNIYNNVNLFGGGATANSSNQTVFTNDLGFNARLNYGTLSQDRSYELPDASGTIALLSDVVTSTLQEVTASANKNLTDNINLQGTESGDGNTQPNVNAFGYRAGKNNQGEYLNAFGINAANGNEGVDVNALGAEAAMNNTGSSINALGADAALNNIGSSINALGNGAAGTNTGDNINAMGEGAASANTGDNVNALGYQAGVSNSYSHVTLLGKSAQATANKQLVLADGTLNARVSYINLTANRTYELPDVSGTLTITSGVGTSGFITRWVSATAVGASTLLSDNSSTISIGNSSPSASARLQVDSTVSGFLPPRMTTTQRNAISSPAEGLCVYDSTLHKLYVYDGTIWNACW